MNDGSSVIMKVDLRSYDCQEQTRINPANSEFEWASRARTTIFKKAVRKVF